MENNKYEYMQKKTTIVEDLGMTLDSFGLFESFDYYCDFTHDLEDYWYVKGINNTGTNSIGYWEARQEEIAIREQFR